ncbi:MAG TPA: sigma-70 family RNA polymerase sigma factor [Vicinamibacterales bacterium]|nr:sigma-70 family RNA polymerase sigma factor [Vicinamibacterales bacterium]
MDADRRIVDIVEGERNRLRNFIRRRVPQAEDVEDILQEVFAELVEANRKLMPIDHVSGWLFRVARNRIIDLLRRKEPERFGDSEIVGADGELVRIEDLLESETSDPEEEYGRRRLVEELQKALSELPDEQRAVFVAHEIQGRSFKQIAAQTGVNLNTLLARKRYAVLHLRERLQRAFDEFRIRKG